MTAKQFFKSTAFKCIAVLTSILLLSGVILAICWGFMEVTDEERFNRKIALVYPGETVTAVEKSLDGMNRDYGVTKINKCWAVIEKDDVIVEAKSKGYNGGITCWVTISVNEDLKADTALDGLTVKGIRMVQIYKADAADELTGNIKDYVYDKFVTDYAPGVKYEYGNENNKEQYINTGASHSLTAVCNCVNASIDFISGKEDPYAAYSYRELIDIDSSAWTVDGTTVTYTIVTTANGKPGPFTIRIKTDGTKIADDGFTITVNGSTSQKYIDRMSEEAKDLSGKTLDEIKGYLADTASGGALVTGATRSNELCLNAAAFALANYETCLKNPKEANSDSSGPSDEDPYEALTYKELIDIDSSAWTVDGTTVTYTIVTTANGKPQPFTIQIKTDGTKIADDGFTITVNGSTSQKYIDRMSEEAKDLSGKTLDEIKGYLADTTSGGALVTGATRSNELCLNAAAFALANYQACLNSPKGGN